MFLNADDDVIREIADLIKARKGRTQLIRKFISENRTFLRNKERYFRPLSNHTQGRFHNLREIFDALNSEYFGERIIASINWGKRNSRRALRNRTLGSYCGHTNTIRINPVLDRRNAPHYFIRYVIYHEMLHGAVKEEKKNGRRLVHTAEFRKRERLFKAYEKAIAWERRHIL